MTNPEQVADLHAMTGHEQLFAQYSDRIFDAATMALIVSGSHGDVVGLDDLAVPDAEALLKQTEWWASIFEHVEGASA